MTHPAFLSCYRLLLVLGALGLFNGCQAYVTPGAQADLSTFTDPRVKKAFVAKPAIHFPANLAIVRVQAGGYQSESAQGFGEGAYSVVTSHDVEQPGDADQLTKLPGVAGVVTLNRLLLPRSLTTDLDLREAAAKLQTDAVIVYTIATEFRGNSIIPPLTTLSLGLFPNKQYKINATASAIVMDTRTGYIYGALEETELRSGLTIAWGSNDAIDSARKQAERAAFVKLLASYGPFWERIRARYGR